MNAMDKAWRLLKNDEERMFNIGPKNDEERMFDIGDFLNVKDNPEQHLGIVGSRNLRNYPAFEQKVNEWIDENGQPHSIISGGQRGADSFARRYAEENDIPFKEHHHNTYRHMGSPRMYHHRNQLVVNDSTHLLAFPSKRGRGTQVTMGMANKKGIPVQHHFEEDLEEQ
tara:strand:- start:108 stop:614 length:507 start_codon:yes stop_codon:yes gene_type:complete